MFLRRTPDCLPLASLDTMTFRGSAYLPSRRREASCVVYQNGRHADRRVSMSLSLSLPLFFDTTQCILRIQRVPQKEKPWMTFVSEESRSSVRWAFRMDVR